MLGWFQAIMPKEDKFFDLFEQHAGLVVAGAEALRSLPKGGEAVENCRAQILSLENQADEITRQVLIAVRRTFITPFDRSDMQDLIGSLDDAIDQMNKTAKVITLFEVRGFERQMQQMGEDVLAGAKLVQRAMPLLRNIGKNAGELNLITEQIVRVEERADELHDAANSIATIVSTRVLRPRYAVVWAAFFNFIAFMFFGLHVAQTVGVGIVDAHIVDARVIFGALMGAITWNLITWWAGIPSSSSHALIGGLVGAGMSKAGTSAVVWAGLSKTAAAIVLSPMTGFVLALFLVLAVSWILVRALPASVDSAFRHLQFISASLYSLGHGGNDAQKTMGIIAVLLYSQGHMGSEFHVPLWVVLACQVAMALATLFGGWRIVHTMGSKITRPTPLPGSCAEAGGALTLFGATWLGIPVSTTHTITGAIVGVGAARKVSAVR